MAAAVCFGIALAGASAATTASTFTAVADSYVSQKFPTTNYGTKTAMRVGDAPLQRGYVRFNVTGLASPVVRATLRVYATSASSIAFSVRGVAENTWGEKTITYNNAPQPAAAVTASSGAFGTGQWISLDVTPLVVGNGLVSFALTSTAKTQISLSSREGGASLAPQLVVESTAPDSPPTNNAPPTISGTAQEGQTLTATAGSWSGTQPIGYAYQWRRCDSGGANCSDIAGATATGYTLTGADVGNTMRVTVTASNSTGSAAATSAATAVVQAAPAAPSNDAPPTVSGTAQEGQTLSATAGSWSGTPPIGYASQWRRCDSGGGNCSDIAGATATTYTLTGADVGNTIRVAVTASNSAGNGSATSAATAVVEAAPAAAPTNNAPPTVSGTAQEGQTLTATAGSWSGTPPITYGYQWRRCDSNGGACSDIAGATATSDTLTGADVGNTVRVAVTASNSAGSATATSAATAAVQAAPLPPSNDVPPTISGLAQGGQTLTASAGSWSGTQPITYASQWRRCDSGGANCSDIAGATATGYTLTTADVGNTIRVAVTASNSAGNSSVTSVATAVVQAAPVAADPVVMAAGDIACGAKTTGSPCRQMATSDLLVAANPDAVLPLGDEQYQCGELTDFQSFYEPSWGRLKAKTYPAVGNHEYTTSVDPASPCFGLPNGAPGYYGYFGSAASPQEATCAIACKGYYSFNLGSWHVIALNSNCSSIGGCGAGSPQEQWLRQDLAASTAVCTLAYWHHPLFSSGFYRPGVAAVRPLFQALYDYNADVVLSGHDHNYERFAPQDPNGVLDLARGIRQFIVGTGGKDLAPQGSPIANSELRNAATFGVLKLTLRSGMFDWQFVPVAGSTFTDSGTDTCDGTVADVAAPAAPTNLAATAAGSRSAELTWTAATDNVGVISYEVYRDGSLLTTTTAAGYTDNTVAPTTTYSYTVKARDAAGNSSASSNTASVTTPAPNVVSFLPEADARVSEASPATNYGTSYLRVDGGIDPDVESNLRFTVTGLVGPVQSAKLRLYAYSNTVDGPSVYATDNNWQESSVSWNTRPPRTSAASDDKGAIGTNVWVEWDVTPLVVGNGTYGFTLAGTSDDGLDFYSREAASFRPQLVVTYG